jgi:Holliday junction resolvasome RuvABC endonuclease subunit
VTRPVRIVWGIDLGTTSGVVIRNGEDVALATAVCLPSSDARYGEFSKELDQLVAEFGVPDVVYFEEVYAHRGTAACHVYGGLYATLVQTAARWEPVPLLYGVPVQTIKKFGAGHGNAKKEDMVRAASARWPNVAIETDDVADALWIAEYGVREQKSGAHVDRRTDARPRNRATGR